MPNRETTNQERADRAERLLFAYDDARGENPSIISIADLLADLMHYCATTDAEWTFDACLEQARENFASETEEEKRS